MCTEICMCQAISTGPVELGLAQAPRFRALCPCSSPLRGIRQVIAPLRITALKLVLRSTPLLRSILKFSAPAPERS